MMAAFPMTPVKSSSPRKRLSPDDSDNSDNGRHMDEPPAKRMRPEPTMPSTPPPEEVILYGGEKTAFPDDDPHTLVQRSLVLALRHVGFDTASPEALEAFCSQVDTYASHFLAQVTSSMLTARRSQPTPLDFKYALGEEDLDLALLEPHLRPPIPRETYLIQLEPMPAEESPFAPGLIDSLLGDDLSGEPEKLAKPYIPNRFPTFPSKHTYKWTEKESDRITDPRKIREEAAKAAKHGEDALRRLTRVAKIGKEKDVKNLASKDPKSKERYQLWEKAMGDLLSTQPPKITTGKGEDAEDENDRGLIVNSEKVFYRKGATAKRRQTIEVRASIES